VQHALLGVVDALAHGQRALLGVRAPRHSLSQLSEVAGVDGLGERERAHDGGGHA
jgi:hypothetical protein